MDLNSDRHETNDNEVEWEIQIGLTIEAEESVMEAESKIGEDIADEWEKRIASAIEAAQEAKIVDVEAKWGESSILNENTQLCRHDNALEMGQGMVMKAKLDAFHSETNSKESSAEKAHSVVSSILNENTQLCRHDNALEMGQGMVMKAKLDAFHSETNSKESSAEKAHSVVSSILNENTPSSSHETSSSDETEVALRREVEQLSDRCKRKRKEYRLMQLQLATKKLRRLARADQIVSLGQAMECATKYARNRTRNESAELKMLQKDRLFAEMEHDRYFGQNTFREELSLRMRSIEDGQ